jgi:hypothetical protein
MTARSPQSPAGRDPPAMRGRASGGNQFSIPTIVRTGHGLTALVPWPGMAPVYPPSGGGAVLLLRELVRARLRST